MAESLEQANLHTAKENMTQQTQQVLDQLLKSMEKTRHHG
jgi:hypothetical protein